MGKHAWLFGITAAVAAQGVWAQSSVTLFGVLDVAIARGTGSIANRTQELSLGLGGNQLGLRGTEDLGGSLKAGFWLEGLVNVDTGAGAATNSNNQTTGTGAGLSGFTFNRRSTLGIGGELGELRLGRDYPPTYWNIAAFDPFGNLGVGTTQTLSSSVAGQVSVRVSNSVAYHYGQAFNAMTVGTSADGLYGSAMHYFGENLSATPTGRDGSGSAARIGWNQSGLHVALATGQTNYVSGDLRQTNGGASYNFGGARAMAHFAVDRLGPVTAHGYLVGALVPVGRHLLRTSYSSYKTDASGSPTVARLAIGYVYNLSLRTALYGTAARVSNSGGASFALNGALTGPDRSSSGIDLGIRTSF